jgi:nicotinate-nucleotide adenylyltransferase
MKAAMRLGLLGGTFDPVHYGHLILAECCREELQLDEVWFVPTGNPPHKAATAISPGKHRCQMLELATAGVPEFLVSRIEQENTKTTFTVDTLQRLVSEDPGRDLFFIMGGDSLLDLKTWRQPDRIAELATIVAVNRGRDALPSREQLVSELGESIANRIHYVQIPAIDLSSSEIRHRSSAGMSIRFRVPRAVEVYLHENELYSTPRPDDRARAG